MASTALRTSSGGTTGDVELDDAVFGIEPNVAVMHQVVTAQLAAARAGSHSTLTRAEVAGGGAKPWRQKGTGRARQGSIRAPHWRGGGVAFGPKPRSYRQRTPKKMVRLALVSALSDRAREGRVVVLDGWGISTPRTKDAIALLRALDLDGQVVVVVGHADAAAARSFRNLPDVHVLPVGELNAYDVLRSDWMVFTRATLPGGADAGHGPEGGVSALLAEAPVDVEPTPTEDVADVEPIGADSADGGTSPVGGAAPVGGTGTSAPAGGAEDGEDEA